jgi:hypothetical protein
LSDITDALHHGGLAVPIFRLYPTTGSCEDRHNSRGVSSKRLGAQLVRMSQPFAADRVEQPLKPDRQVTTQLGSGRSAEEALTQLHAISQPEHRKLAEVAQHIVDEAVRRARARRNPI